MDKDLKLLKAAIKRETDKLICESHPNVCALRDANFSRLEELVINEIFSNKTEEPVSLQTVLARLEREI